MFIIRAEDTIPAVRAGMIQNGEQGVLVSACDSVSIPVLRELYKIGVYPEFAVADGVDAMFVFGYYAAARPGIRIISLNGEVHVPADLPAVSSSAQEENAGEDDWSDYGCEDEYIDAEYPDMPECPFEDEAPCYPEEPVPEVGAEPSQEAPVMASQETESVNDAMPRSESGSPSAYPGFKRDENDMRFYKPEECDETYEPNAEEEDVYREMIAEKQTQADLRQIEEDKNKARMEQIQSLLLECGLGEDTGEADIAALCSAVGDAAKESSSRGMYKKKLMAALASTEYSGLADAIYDKTYDKFLDVKDIMLREPQEPERADFF